MKRFAPITLIAFLAGLFLAMPQAQAAITVVQAVGASSGGGSSATATLSSTHAGNMLVVAIWYDATTEPSPTITDNSSGGANTYVSTGEWENGFDNSGYNGSHIYYAKNIKGGNTTVGVTGPTTLRFCVYEIAGVDPSSPLNAHAHISNQTSSSMVSPSIMPSAGDIVIATCAGKTPPNGASAPFTLDYSATLTGAGGGAGGACAHDIVGSGSSISATFTTSGAIGYGSVIASFKAANNTTTLASSQNPSLSGGAVTFTATVTGTGGTPTGTVIFKDGANSLATNTLNSSGVANFSTASLAVTNSPHFIIAVYGGDGTFVSTSSSLSQTVGGPNTITITNPGFELNGSGNPYTAGSELPFYSSFAPYGWTAYSAGNNSYGAWSPTTAPANLTGYVGNNVGYLINDAGSAVMLYQDLGSVSQSGNYQLTLLVGNDKFGANQGNPTVVLATGSSFGTGGSGLTAVTPSSSSTPALTYGVMSTWTFNYTISAGSHVWVELKNSLGATVVHMDFDNLSLVGGIPTTNILTSSSNPSANGQSVTFTAGLTNLLGGGTPTNGTVTFYDNGTNTLGTGTLNTNGVATLTTSALSVGTHSITAAYGGGGSYGGSISSAVSQVVNAFGTVSKLAFGVQPGTTTAGSAISPAVTVIVQDSYGNTVTSDGSSVTISSSTTAFTGSTLSVNASSGVATFSVIKPTTAGSANTLTASDGSLTGTNSSTFTVNATTATVLAFTTQPSGATAGSAFTGQPVVKTQDVYGNNSTVGLGGTVTVTLALNTGTGTLQGTTAYNIGTGGGDGTITGSGLRIDQAGSFTLKATATSFTQGDSGSFTIANVAPVANGDSYSRGPGVGIKIHVSNLLANDTDANGDTVTYVSSDSTTTHGVSLGISGSGNSTIIVYPSSAANSADSFQYIISDGSLTATGLVSITISNSVTGQNATITVSGNTATITFYGVPGLHYAVQRSTDMNNWADITVTSGNASIDNSLGYSVITAPTGVAFTVTDALAPNGSAYYRLRAAP
ncbi:MAG: Ig-like domain repeat protein [Verrucomicrobiota bacterium]|jgi:hypothetical protein